MARTRPTQLPAIIVALAAFVMVAFLSAGCGDSKTATTNASTQASTPPPTTSTASPSTERSATTSSPTTASTSTAPAKEPTPPPAEEEKLPSEGKVMLSSPAFAAGGEIPARYTCDGQNKPPPLRIKGTPPGTRELMLDILNIKPVNGELYFSWAITGISPDTTVLKPQALPPGTIVGANSEGHTAYNLCPPKGQTETYVAVLFALPHHLPASSGFDSTALRLKALHTAKYEALLTFRYARQ